MTTQLKRFTEAYAVLTIAVYEPLIVKWYSQQGFATIAQGLVRGAISASGANSNGNSSRELVSPEAYGVIGAVSEELESDARLTEEVRDAPAGYINSGTSGLRSTLLRRYPNLELTGTRAYYGGRMEVVGDGLGVDGRTEREPAIPLIFESGAASQRLQLDVPSVQDEIVTNLLTELQEKLVEIDKPLPGRELQKLVLASANKAVGKFGGKVFAPLMPEEGEWLEELSPIGIAHLYRQLYYYVSEGVGPIEQAFTVAPAESLEVVTETVRRQSHEEIYEMGSEVVSETAVESRNVDEVSDKVASLIQRDSTAAMSANTTFEASGGVGVWNIGASAAIGGNTSMSQSSQQATELARRRLKEVTKRAAERITKTFSLQVRDATDLTTTNLVRRLIKNETATPVNYGLRRVFSRIRVKVQDVGPTLVWQLYVSDPGAGLARSRFVHFMDAVPVASPGDPPAIRPRPEGGVDSGTSSSSVTEDTTKPLADPMRFFVKLVITVPPDRQVTAVSIDSITDLEHLAKDDYAPSPNNNAQRPGVMDPSKGTYTVEIGILPGDAASVSVSYSYTYQPSAAVLAAWQQEFDAAQQKFRQQEADAREKALREQFERQRSLITEKSKIRSRPAADLRREERYEVLNRMISHLFRPKGKGNPGAPTPIEIELFHRYLDIDAMFVYMHPSWWIPRYAGKTAPFGRPEYEVTAESEPARLGRSLGWAMQLDGDDRRNEFLNSPWVRVCIPMRAGREREAIAWIAKYIEGEIGYDPSSDPLKSLLSAIEKTRKNQKEVGSDGPDYVDASTVVVDATAGAPAGPLKPEDVYPVVDEFEVTVPTEGFVYDDLTVKIP
jgi:hypothetical protein